ncbi:MAG TPA: radical SAM protein [Deltaproteobacteria bacterium]|nr:radical SAM protein [Deltaproteobacteria bacterium]
MKSSIKHSISSLLEEEQNLCPNSKSRGGGISVCLVYPNRYNTGMSSLGFQTAYRLLTEAPGIVCERAFLPDRDELVSLQRSGRPLLSMEGKRPLADFDVIAFSTSFEPDYLNIPLMLNLARIPLQSAQRSERHSLVIAGGAAFFINPEPVADFFDIICIGEGEELIPALAAALNSTSTGGRQDLLQQLANQPGFYIPAFYVPHYRAGNFAGYETKVNAPTQIRRVCPSLEAHPPAQSVILSEHTEFGDMFLVEVSRGCPRGCRFCSSGFIYAPFRQQPYDNLVAAVDQGLLHRSKIGLVGAAVSDYRDIGRLCRHIVDKGGRVSVSSLRVDCIDEQMLDALIASGHKTIALAPEGGSQRMRDIIRKNLTEEQILSACDRLISRDILNLKLYFIIGLPTETMADLEEMIRLVKTIRERVIEKAKANRRLGEITLSVNPFIPKPFTPFQWCGMEPLPSLEKKVKFLESHLRSLSNVKMKVESLKGCYLQALLSRGDRRCAPLLEEMAKGSNLKQSARLCGLDTDGYVHRSIPLEAPLPWDILGTANTGKLKEEYGRAFASSKDC